MAFSARQEISNYRESVCYIYIWWNMKEKEHVLISQFSTKYFATNFRSFLKNCYNYFRVTFSKKPFWLLAYFFVVVELDNFGRIFDNFWHPWLLRDNSDGCWWNSDMVYLYVVGCWMHVQWLGAEYSEGVYIRPWHANG